MNLGRVRMTCLDCHHHRMVSRNELNRAARVRCMHCGGPLEVSHSGRDKLAEGQQAANEQKVRMKR